MAAPCWSGPGRAGLRLWEVAERCEPVVVILMARAAMGEGPWRWVREGRGREGWFKNTVRRQKWT